MSDATYPQVLLDNTTCCPEAIAHPTWAWHNHDCPVLIAWAEDWKANRPEGPYYLPHITYPYELTIKSEWSLAFDPIAYCAAHRDEYDRFTDEHGYEDWEKPLNFVAQREAEYISGPYSQGNHYLPVLKVDERETDFEDLHRKNPFTDLIDDELVDTAGNKVSFDQQFAALLDKVAPRERPVADVVAELDQQLPLEVVQPDPRTQLIADARAVSDKDLEDGVRWALEVELEARLAKMRGQRAAQLETMLAVRSVDDVRTTLGLNA